MNISIYPSEDEYYVSTSVPVYIYRASCLYMAIICVFGVVSNSSIFIIFLRSPFVSQTYFKKIRSKKILYSIGTSPARYYRLVRRYLNYQNGSQRLISLLLISWTPACTIAPTFLKGIRDLLEVIYTKSRSSLTFLGHFLVQFLYRVDHKYGNDLFCRVSKNYLNKLKDTFQGFKMTSTLS